MESPALQLTAIVVLGVSAQWMAWRLRIPSILLLLLFGFAVGPLAAQFVGVPLIDPDQVLGGNGDAMVLMAIVSLSVGVILFEGGLNLRFAELREVGGVVWSLITIGVLITGTVAAVAAHYILGFPWSLAALLGAILTVTGPTVIGPLLRSIRPVGKAGAVVKWEGITIDPIGAVLSVLVFEAVLAGRTPGGAAVSVAGGIIRTLLIGGVLGLTAAWLLQLLLRRHWIPDYLHDVATLTLVLTALAASNHLQHESGLVAATIMGVALANQSRVSIRHILSFKESLSVLLISSLFIILAARIEWVQLQRLSWWVVLFVLVLIVVARPLAVLLSTWRSTLTWRERAFVAWMAPRGIVAAAVASLFALQFARRGIDLPMVQELVPVTFVAIVGTVAVYGLTAPLLARWLSISNTDPQGVLMVGANRLAQEIAQIVQDAGFRVLVVDLNRSLVRQARQSGLIAIHGDILSQDLHERLDLAGIGRLMALTPSDEANALAALRYREVFGRAEVYQLPQERAREQEETRPTEAAGDLYGRILFTHGATFADLMRRLNEGWRIRQTKLTERFGFEEFQQEHPDAIPLMLLSRNRLQIVATDWEWEPSSGYTVVSICNEDQERRRNEWQQKGRSRAQRTKEGEPGPA